MLGRGYDQVDASSLEPVYDSGTGRWEIPLSTDGMGWFATAQEGAFTGAGAADDEGYCDGRFRESRSLQLDSETGLPLSLYWAPPVGQFGSFKIEVGYALPFGIINWYSLAIEVTLTPFPPAPPPSPPATPAPSAPTYFCDIAVVGQGLAGSTAAMVAALLRPDATVCSVGPGTDSSTSAMAGAAWLVIPDVEEAGVAPLVDALATLAAKSELAFDAERSEYFIKMAAAAQAFVESATGTVLKPVLAWEEGEETSRTGPGSTFCTVLGYLQSVPLLGRAVPKLYELGGCAGTATWPPYYDELEEVLAGKVKQVLDESSVGASMCLFMAGAMTMGELMERMLAQVPTVITGTVLSASFDDDAQEWVLAGSDFVVRSSGAIFASGGFGTVATDEELSDLNVHSTSTVHASNDGLLWRTAKAHNWTREEVNGWYLEMTDPLPVAGPSWFLWDARATVLQSTADGGYSLVYDEAKSYDTRGRARKAAGAATTSYYLTLDPSSNVTTTDLLGPAAQHAIDVGAVPKACSSRSDRLWRDYLHVCLNDGPPADDEECSRRVAPTDTVKLQILNQGIIDTISGPVVDKYQRFHAAGWAAGNAASPGLTKMYTGPGSTLGNALMSGYIAALNATSVLLPV